MANHQKDNDQKRDMLYYQVGTGTLAVVLVGFGAWGYLAATVHPFTTGMAIRIGATLAVISLALPQLSGMRRRLPSIALAFGLLALFFIAVRAKVGNILIGVLAVALSANAALAWLARVTGKK